MKPATGPDDFGLVKRVGLLTDGRLFLNILVVGLPFDHCRFTD